MDFEPKPNSVYRTTMTIVITAIVTFLITTIGMYNYFIGDKNGNIEILSKKIEISDSTDELSTKIEILNKYLEESYIGELNKADMIEGAIKGYVEGIDDEYTEYLTQEEYEDLLISVNGNYVGIGIYMTENIYGEVIVLLPIEGSPAKEVGLKAGDIITKVDGEECTELGLDEVANKVKGEEGTTVELEVLRDEETLKFTVERKTVELQYITSKMLDDNIGYIQMLVFDTGCTQKFKNHLENLQKQGMTSLIIDLRDNSGGIVDDAIDMVELFVPKNKIIMRSYDKDEVETITISESEETLDVEVVLLVNENSASATEIFSAALQENNIAKVIGTTTFGKGVMQEVQPIPIGGALKVTVEEFKTPNAKTIHEVGIEPDIKIEDSEKQLERAIQELKK